MTPLATDTNAKPAELLSQARDAGLAVYPWTFRNEVRWPWLVNWSIQAVVLGWGHLVNDLFHNYNRSLAFLVWDPERICVLRYLVTMSRCMRSPISELDSAHW